MGDLGKVLYNIHVANCIAANPDFGSKIKAWESLMPEAQETWRKTAQQFAQHIN